MTRTTRGLRLAISLLLASLTLAVYWQVLSHGFLTYDDCVHITRNPWVREGLSWQGVSWAFTTIYESNWHPLTWLSLMLDAEIGGMKPAFFHFTNLLLHVVNTLLVLMILERLTGLFWRSAFVAALFALHPLHVESVAWISERKDVLSALIGLLAILAYARYAETPSLRRYGLVLAIFGLGLMAKPILVTLPVLFLLLDYWPLGRMAFPPRNHAAAAAECAPSRPVAGAGARGRPGAVSERRSPESPRADTDRAGSESRQVTLGPVRLLLEKVPLLLLSAASSTMTLIAQHRGGSVGSLELYPLTARVGNACVAYVAYIGKMLWPAQLAIIYPHPGSGLPAWKALGAFLLLLAISAFALFRARTRTYLIVGWLWYLIALLPVIGLIQVGLQGMADRYTYMSLIGPFIILAWGTPDLAGSLARHLPAPVRPRPVVERSRYAAAPQPLP